MAAHRWPGRDNPTVDQPVVVRLVVAEDTAFLQRMLYEAVNTRPGKTWPDFEVSMREPRNRRFWFAWGRDGDLGVIAEHERRAIGAAWIRRFDGDDLEPVDDPDVPVMAIGIERDHRSVGVGGLLLDGLIESARLAKVEVIALSVNTWNEAGLRLYGRRGFEESSRTERLVRMRLTLS
jgi:ribosomal protein S18 acetylase RimI-like enzyme